MNRPAPKPLWNYLPLLILISSLLAVYMRTLAPGLSWANAGSDGGDLISAAATGGVPHPTGYPLYLLLAYPFQWLPIGSLAFRTNLLSAVFTALAAALVYRIVTHSAPGSNPRKHGPAGMAAASAFGLAPLVWSQAVITEVYGLQVLLFALILHLYATIGSTTFSVQKRLDYLRGLALGLATGNHITTILLAPVAILAGSMQRQPEIDGVLPLQHPRFGRVKLDGVALLRQLAGFVAALSLYLILPLRAFASPPINWGNVLTPERFWWLVSGRLYQSYYLELAPPELWARIQSCAALLLEQFGLPGVSLGLIGLIVFGTRSRLSLLTVWMAVTFTAFAVFYGSDDSYVNLIPAFLCFAIWAGLGIANLASQFHERSFLVGLFLGLLMMAFLLARVPAIWSQVDASHDLRAETFGREVLSAAPEKAIVFADGDRAVFTLWYYHFALRERPDLAVLATDLLHFDWYQENLHATYPSLLIPIPFPWPATIAGANPGRAVCYVQYSDQSEINCSEP